MITGCITELNAAGYTQTAEILAIARLDLLAKLHGVSDEELEALITTRCAVTITRAKNVKASRDVRKRALPQKPIQNKSC